MIVIVIDDCILAANGDGIVPGVWPGVGDLPVLFGVSIHGLIEHQPEDQGESCASSIFFLCFCIDLFQRGPDLIGEGGVADLLAAVSGAAIHPVLVHRQVDIAQAAVGDGKGRVHTAGEGAIIPGTTRPMGLFVRHLIPVVFGGHVEDLIVVAVANCV